MSYKRCPYCESLIDPGEQNCGCIEQENLIRQKYNKLTTVNKDGQFEIGGLMRNAEYNKNKNKELVWN